MVSQQAAGFSVAINAVNEPNARLLDVSTGIGSGNVNTCRFEIVQTSTGAMKTNNASLEGLAGQNQLVEVTYINPATGGTQLIFRGRVTGAQISIAPEGEKVIYEAALTKQMVSTTFAQKVQYSIKTAAGESSVAADFTEAYSESDMVFNPVINGVPHPNKTAMTLNAPYAGGHVFVDPRSVSTDVLLKTIETRAGETQVVTNPVSISPLDSICDYWCLREVVEYLVATLHINTYVSAPVTSALPEDGTQIRNLQIRRGAHLTEALDTVLSPYGFYWWIDFRDPFSGPIIKIDQRGSAPASGIFTRQVPGDTVDQAQTTVWSMNIRYDISPKTVSTTQCMGNEVVKEGTFELVPAWDISAANSIEDDDILGSEPDVAGDNGPVWRKWVLNEAGDYTDLNFGAWYPQQDWTSTDQTSSYEVFDWSTFFGADVADSANLIRRRSRLLPTVILNKSGTGPQGPKDGVFLEYGTYSDGKWWWRPVDSLADPKSALAIDSTAGTRSAQGLGVGWRLLRDEAGIMFDEVPLTLRHRAQSDESEIAYHPRLRVTASLAADQRVLATANAAALPVDAYTHATLVTQFKKKVIAKTGDYKSVFWDGVDGQAGGFTGDDAYKDGTFDDSTAIADYAQDVVDRFSQATVTGDIVVPFISPLHSELGVTVQNIAALGLNMRTNDAAAVTPTYATVVKARIDVQQQTTTVTLGSP